MTEHSMVSRRGFLVRTAAAGGALVLGFYLPFAGRSWAAEGTDEKAEVNAWIIIQPDDSVVIRVARSEMGQGVLTSLPMLVAEELECDWARVRAEYALAGENLKRSDVFGSMATGGSRSVRESEDYLRQAGAVARELLVTAAAQRWGVLPAECRAVNSVIYHTPSGRRTTFGAVAQDAAALPPPTAPIALKVAKDWRLIGQRVKRLDTPDKVSGKAIFGFDVRQPAMLYAAIRGCPVFGGRLKSYDAQAIETPSGVLKVVALDDAVAVVADSYWRADRALRQLPVVWDEGAHAAVNSATIGADLRAGLNVDSGAVGHASGDAEAALMSAEKRIEAEYYAPYLAHATMEPMNCTAHVTTQGVEVWVPTQNATAALMTAAQTAGVDPRRVTVHNTLLGGGFGRRGTAQDYVKQAVQIAKTMDQPVQLIWSREEDMRHDFYRPASMARLWAGLDDGGLPSVLKARISAYSIIASLRPGWAKVEQGLDPIGLQAFDHEFPYAIPNQRMEYVLRNAHVPVGFWRSVNHSQNAFFRECFIDEVAHAGGHDPYRLRRQLLAAGSKPLTVLDAVAKRAKWDEPTPPGIFRGLALNSSYGSHCAQVVEVSLADNGKIRLQRVLCAIDSGHVVNPDTVAAQVESAVVYGLTAALYGEITIKDGRVEQGNFDDYPMLLLKDMPKVEIVMVPSGDFWGGLGEPPLPPATPALCNALFAATGKRVRSLPLSKHGLV